MSFRRFFHKFAHPGEDDMDGQMILGCTGFLILSIAGYMLAVWPFFAFLAIETRAALGRNVALGLGPHLLLAAVGSRRFGVAGGCGAAGGAAAAAVFLYLRLDQARLAALLDQGGTPQWPTALVALVPCAWLLAIVTAAILFVPPEAKAEKPR